MTDPISNNRQLNLLVVKGPETNKNQTSILGQLESRLKNQTSFGLKEIANILSNCRNIFSWYEFGDRASTAPGVEFWSDIIGLTLNLNDPRQPVLLVSLQTNPLLFDQIYELPKFQKEILNVIGSKRDGSACFTITIDLAQCTQGLVIKPRN